MEYLYNLVGIKCETVSKNNDKNIEKQFFCKKDYSILYNTENQMYSMRMNRVMMIDIDFDKSNLKTTNDVINMARKFSEKYGDTFRLYKSNGGVHVFLTNRKYGSEYDQYGIWQLGYKEIEYMLKFGCDKHYVAFSSQKGCLVRLNPKNESDIMYYHIATISPDSCKISEELPEIISVIDKHLEYSKLYKHSLVNKTSVYRQGVIDKIMGMIDKILQDIENDRDW